MAKRWVVAAKKADFNAIASRYGISPYLARIIRNRDVITDEEINMYLNGDVNAMHDGKLLNDMEEAGEIIAEAIEAGVKIRIVGDYDSDGVCASYILHKGLEYMGAVVDVRLPDRIGDGYGINARIINEAAQDGVELIITCDNGISAADEVRLAMSLGISVVVTDHHEVPYTEDEMGRHYILPEADAVIDPKREDCDYPFEGICGAMVAYKLIIYMMDKYTDASFDIGTCSRAKLKDELLSFAAFATIADIMELRDENRVAVKKGLEILKNTTNIGMKALMDVTKVNTEVLSAYHIGFILAPSVNASGRLDSALKALELFLTDSEEEATRLATELFELNTERKNMTVSYTEQAIQLVNEQYSNDRVIVLLLEDCHESIAGIIAGKVREQFYRPTIVLTLDHEGNVKGSGRSIEDYDMHAELIKVSELFTKFGGHKMAAGMSMVRENVDELRRRLNDNCTLTDEELVEKLVIDIPLPVGYVTMNLVQELDKLAPFGVANPTPLFAQKDVPVKSVRLIGKNQNVLKMVLEGVDSANRRVNMDAILYQANADIYEELKNRETISILYQATVNEYMGTSSVQLVIRDYM